MKVVEVVGKNRKDDFKMATLLDALKDCTYDLQNKRDTSGDFAKKLLTYRDKIVSDYLKFGIGLNKAISEVAKRDNLNDDQIQRIVEETNNQIYLIKYDKLKASNERDVEFDIASVRGVRDCIKGNSSTSQNNEDDKDENNKSEKIAFETEKMSDDYFEKIASEQNSYDFFSGKIKSNWGDLSCGNKVSQEQYFIEKIASKIHGTEDELDKIAKCVTVLSDEIGEMFVQLEKKAGDTNRVMSHMIKTAGLVESEIKLLKDATNKNLKLSKEACEIPDFVEIKFDNINLEKTAREKFSLGNFSLNKEASYKSGLSIPNILLSSGKLINGVIGVEKVACEFKNMVSELRTKNSEYMAMKEKCASVGIEQEMLEDDYFILNKQAGTLESSIAKLQSVAKTPGIKNSVNQAIKAPAVQNPVKNATKEITQNIAQTPQMQSPVKNTTKEITQKFTNNPPVQKPVNNMADMQKAFNKATRGGSSRAGSKVMNNPIQQQNNIPALNNNI